MPPYPIGFVVHDRMNIDDQGYRKPQSGNARHLQRQLTVCIQSIDPPGNRTVHCIRQRQPRRLYVGGDTAKTVRDFDDTLVVQGLRQFEAEKGMTTGACAK